MSIDDRIWDQIDKMHGQLDAWDEDLHAIENEQCRCLEHGMFKPCARCAEQSAAVQFVEIARGNG